MYFVLNGRKKYTLKCLKCKSKDYFMAAFRCYQELTSFTIVLIYLNGIILIVILPVSSFVAATTSSAGVGVRVGAGNGTRTTVASAAVATATVSTATVSAVTTAATTA